MPVGTADDDDELRHRVREMVERDLERLRNDTAFRKRLARLLEEHRPVLDGLRDWDAGQ